MDFFEISQNQNKKCNYNNKKRLSHDQIRVLERSFSSSKKLEPEQKLQLANQLGIPPRQVAIWYQNKRARWRTQSIELDCGALQVRLEAVAAEKRILEREVERLRRELHKAKEQLVFALECKKSSPGGFNSASDSETNNWCEVVNNNNVEGGYSVGSSSFCDVVVNDSYNQESTTLIVDDHHDDDNDQVLQFDHEFFASFIHGSDDHYERLVL